MDFDDNNIINSESEEEIETAETETEETETEETEETETVENEIDYSSILEEMNARLENIERNTIDYSGAFNGILQNIYFLDFVGFTLFIFLMLFVVIKFFKIFF